MAFHRSNLGSYGTGLPADMNGYVPEDGDGPWSLSYDHGGEDTHDEDGDLTPYGEWWEEDRWPEIVTEAVAATERSEAGVREWQDA